MEVFANGGVLAGLKIHHFQGFTVLEKYNSDKGKACQFLLENVITPVPAKLQLHWQSRNRGPKYS